MTDCFLKPAILLFCICFGCSTMAQDKWSTLQQQLTIVSENDNYTFRLKDRYYTNGLMLRYSRALNKTSPAIHKKVLSIEVGQKIFNPYQQDEMFAATLDRPFTGLLYIQGGFSYFSSKGHMWRWHLQ